LLGNVKDVNKIIVNYKLKIPIHIKMITIKSLEHSPTTLTIVEQIASRLYSSFCDVTVTWWISLSLMVQLHDLNVAFENFIWKGNQ